MSKSHGIKIGKRLALVKYGKDVFLVQKLRLPKAALTSATKAMEDGKA